MSCLSSDSSNRYLQHNQKIFLKFTFEIYTFFEIINVYDTAIIVYHLDNNCNKAPKFSYDF